MNLQWGYANRQDVDSRLHLKRLYHLPILTIIISLFQ
jgi:hypothetical protein